MHRLISKIKYLFQSQYIFINIYNSTMIFNSLYEINISLVGIIYQIMYLMYQINPDLISIK